MWKYIIGIFILIVLGAGLLRQIQVAALQDPEPRPSIAVTHAPATPASVNPRSQRAPHSRPPRTSSRPPTKVSEKQSTIDSHQSIQPSNAGVDSFRDAKKIAYRIFSAHPVTIYCPCRYSNHRIDLESCGYEIKSDAERAHRLEWEHVVPAEAFGQSFVEWRDGSESCVKRKTNRPFRGRKCAETNPDFNRMEGDLYNLWPIIGELNGLRSNYSMAEITGDAETFGGCRARIQDRKFEPMDEDKGVVARDYMYMDSAYPGRGIISDKNRKLFDVWDQQHPVTDWECRRARTIARIQGNVNLIVDQRCHAANL